MTTTMLRGLVLALGLGLVGCAREVTPQPIYLGHVADLGSDRPGANAAQGIRLALEELTQAQLSEELQGRPLHVVHADTRGQLETYEPQAVRLVDINRVVGLLGGTTPDEALHLERARVPLLTLARSPVPAAGEMVFHVGMQAARQGEVLGQFAAEDLQVDQVLILIDRRREVSQTVADAFQKTFTQQRPKAKAPVLLRFEADADWDELAEAVVKQQPQALVFAGEAADFRTLRKKLEELPTLLFAGDDGATMSADRQPIYLATAFLPDKELPEAQTFANRYREAFKTTPDVHAALGYESLRMMAEALKQVNPTPKREKLRDELRTVKDFPGLVGPLTMTADHQVQRTLLLVRLDGTTLTLVKRYPPPE